MRIEKDGGDKRLRTLMYGHLKLHFALPIRTVPPKQRSLFGGHERFLSSNLVRILKEHARISLQA